MASTAPDEPMPEQPMPEQPMPEQPMPEEPTPEPAPAPEAPTPEPAPEGGATGRTDVDAATIRRAMKDWDRLCDLMRDTSSDFRRLDVAVLPPLVQPVGGTFVEAWTGFAEQATTDADAIRAGLDETLADFLRTEEVVASTFTRFGASIGCGGDPQPAPVIVRPAPEQLEKRLGPIS